MDNFKITVADGKANIYTPYNADFVSRVKLLGGRWNASDRCWAVPEDAVEDVRAAMREIYGRDDRPVVDAADVVLTFGEEVSEYCAPITLLGRTIARAFGRDTGAKVGENVMFIQGAPRSGGSMKNWLTVIPSGCVVKCLRGPRAALDAAELPDGVTMEIINTRMDREALEDEKARLLARLAEIEKLLNGGITHG